MNNSICQYYESELLYESFFEDIKNKFSNINFIENLNSKIDKKVITHKAKIKKIEGKLKEKGIDPDFIKTVTTKHVKQAIKQIHKNNDVKNIAKISLNHFSNAVDEVKGEIKKSVGEATLFSIGLLFVVVMINSFLLALLTILCVSFGLAPIFGFYLTAIFVAPLTEEYGKYISIKYDSVGSYFIFFNTLEFFSYIFQLVGSGMSLTLAILLRSLPVLMHALTTTIQYRMRKNAKKEDKEEASKLGLIAGIMIHFFWNLSAVIGGAS